MTDLDADTLCVYAHMLKRSGVPVSAASLATSDEAREALKVIPDPELGINIVDLGLVYDVDVASDGRVHVTYTLTTFGCAIGPMLEGQMQEVLYSLPGVSDVSVEFTLEPKWSRDRMSDDARAIVGNRELHPPSVQDLRTIGGP
ncbi:MAG: metal-sulfur cluster assembly factor [Acidimicrobiia bacterium]|nr:metal-sulfur cluster assembly factor [Acidimicrobiia bacterium]